ncbi:gliding motility-associated C-terminal domain-containing protein [Polaribacter vadi]|uniref:gliding motility-associated C-terminal domain-containing protein n=1 Tax=Polaribacter TaxID=52959 RepID=UPI001C08CC50|nr:MULTISPECIES: gliding motility-associated C-terminal domain-containing protein [Polaribacter]MBU3011659.1 gliding motility-associated C-terminal domain-containing protein [Polaribacter vadi]MDO6741472.1 gliding motility-associated C-terminal domain-containing protein [Polaribacter sp. 1_MG-2023]
MYKNYNKHIIRKVIFTFLILINISTTSFAVHNKPSIKESIFTSLTVNLVANNDDFSSTVINGLIGGVPGNVFANDTSDGATATSTLVIPSIVLDGNLAGVTISANGNVNVPAGTPSRVFTVTYQICENGEPANCEEALIIIVVNGDSDGDGVLDSDDICNNFDDTLDNDSDGIPDSCDDDDDNDGFSDVSEGCTAQVSNTYQKIHFADGGIDTTDDTDVNLVYSTNINYVDRIGGEESPDNLLFLTGFDPIGGQAKMVFNVRDPYVINVYEFITFKAYLFDNRRDFSGDYDLPIRATINTVSAGAFSVDQLLSIAQTTDLDAGKWIEVEYKIPVSGSTIKEIAINNITFEIEVNSEGVKETFDATTSEVFGVIPLELISDIEGQDCSNSLDCDSDNIPDYQDSSDCGIIEPPVSDFIPNTFTPNGDGTNDVFEIPALLNYPNFKIEIFNRWGNKVHDYSNNGNVNPLWWDGYSDGRLTLNSDKPLPIATYYYIIYFNDDVKEPIQGWVYLNR